MPTSNPQINDPAGQSVMDALTEAGVDPGAAYNATQGIYNMSSEKVIAEIAVSRADVNAAFAEVHAAFAEVNARIDTLEATTAANFHAVDAQLAIVTWAALATFVIVTAMATTGWLQATGWWPRRESAPAPASSLPPDG